MTAEAARPRPVARLRPLLALHDLGNARRLVELHGNDLRYDATADRWRVWDGQRWALDVDGEASRRAKDTAGALLADAGQLEGDDRQKVGKHALRSMNTGPLRAMLELARTEPGIGVVAEQLDRDPWTLNVENGLLDLRTGALRDHDPGALVTKLADVTWRPDATCPTWDRFLERVLPDPDVRDFVRRLSGYMLTGRTTEQVLPVAIGSGSNGKSVFARTLQDLLGDYAVAAPNEVLVARRNGEGPPPNALARLRGARLAVAAETEDGARMNVSIVKQLTGDDRISARELYGRHFDYTPTAKFLLSTNHRPVVADTTESIWRRLLLLPFDVTIPASQRDLELGARISRERDGVLAWAVRGCLEWQQSGLRVPDAVRAATSDYRSSSDSLGQFLDEATTSSALAWVTSAALFSAWTKWANDQGERPGAQNAFSRRLTERGYQPDRTGANSTRIWRGIGLAADAPDTTDTTPRSFP